MSSGSISHVDPDPPLATPTGPGAQLADGVWKPETVLSTFPHRPEVGTESPVPFFHLLERLKTTKREGWRRFGIKHGESISDHMYRMSLITMLCPPDLASKINIGRCTQMALIHDMAESLVGDITPVDKVSKSEKSRREAETMDVLCDELLGRVYGGINGKQIKEIWREYEDDLTIEAHFVHDVDKMELLLQMVEYERAHKGKVKLDEFRWVATRIKLPEVQAWAEEVMNEQTTFWQGLGKGGDVLLPEETKKAQDEYYGGSVGKP